MWSSMQKENFLYRRVKALLAKERSLRPCTTKQANPMTWLIEFRKIWILTQTGSIELCLGDEVTYDIMDETSVTRLWLKKAFICWGAFLTRSISRSNSTIPVWKKVHILEHMNILNKKVGDLLCLEVKLEEADKMLLLLASLHHHRPLSNHHVVWKRGTWNGGDQSYSFIVMRLWRDWIYKRIHYWAWFLRKDWCHKAKERRIKIRIWIWIFLSRQRWMLLLQEAGLCKGL